MFFNKDPSARASGLSPENYFQGLILRLINRAFLKKILSTAILRPSKHKELEDGKDHGD
jgi:hypothetical protein